MLERRLQSAVAQYLDAILDRNLARWFHIPNEGKRSKITGALLKRAGLKAGLPDCVILYLGKFLAIELKTDRGRVTPSQRDWIEWLSANGFPTVICRSLGGVEKALREYGVPTRGR